MVHGLSMSSWKWPGGSCWGCVPACLAVAINVELAGRRRSFLFFFPLCVEGPSS